MQEQVIEKNNWMDQNLILFNILLWQDYYIVQFSLCLRKKKINSLYILKYITSILECQDFISQSVPGRLRKEGGAVKPEKCRCKIHLQKPNFDLGKESTHFGISDLRSSAPCLGTRNKVHVQTENPNHFGFQAVCINCNELTAKLSQPDSVHGLVNTHMGNNVNVSFNIK